MHYTALGMLYFTADSSCFTQLVSTYLNPMPYSYHKVDVSLIIFKESAGNVFLQLTGK